MTSMRKMLLDTMSLKVFPLELLDIIEEYSPPPRTILLLQENRVVAFLGHTAKIINIRAGGRILYAGYHENLSLNLVISLTDKFVVLWRYDHETDSIHFLKQLMSEHELFLLWSSFYQFYPYKKGFILKTTFQVKVLEDWQNSAAWKNSQLGARQIFIAPSQNGLLFGTTDLKQLSSWPEREIEIEYSQLLPMGQSFIYQQEEKSGWIDFFGVTIRRPELWRDDNLLEYDDSQVISYRFYRPFYGSSNPIRIGQCFDPEGKPTHWKNADCVNWTVVVPR